MASSLPSPAFVNDLGLALAACMAVRTHLLPDTLVQHLISIFIKSVIFLRKLKKC